MDLVATERRFLDGLAANAEIDRGLLDGPGTTVIGRADRADSAALACYRAGGHLVVWGDPAVVDRVAALAGPTTLSEDEMAERLGAAGFTCQATVLSNVLDGGPTPPADLASGLLHRWLDGDDPSTVEAVRAFTERCDPIEVDHAALDELDDFDEDAINVVIPGDNHDDDPPHILAYASASKWFWDATMADIGVLVHAAHRRRGLARHVVANTVARLLADGRIPFYRHEISNIGSAAVAASIGFRPIARLDYYVEPSPPEPSTG